MKNYSKRQLGDLLGKVVKNDLIICTDYCEIIGLNQKALEIFSMKDADPWFIREAVEKDARKSLFVLLKR